MLVLGGVLDWIFKRGLSENACLFRLPHEDPGLGEASVNILSHEACCAISSFRKKQ